MYITSDWKDMISAMVPVEPFEEQLLLEAVAAGDYRARDQLVEKKLPLLAEIVRNMRIAHIPEEDLMQLGLIGLIKAIDRYTPETEGGIDLLILQESRKEILGYAESLRPTEREEAPQQADLCRAVENLGETERAVFTMRMGLNGESGRSQAEVAQQLGISPEEVSRAFRQAQIKLKKYL